MKHEINEKDLKRLLKSEMVLVLAIDALQDNEDAMRSINGIVGFLETDGAEKVEDALQVLLNRQENRVNRVIH